MRLFAAFAVVAGLFQAHAFDYTSGAAINKSFHIVCARGNVIITEAYGPGPADCNTRLMAIILQKCPNTSPNCFVLNQNIFPSGCTKGLITVKYHCS